MRPNASGFFFRSWRMSWIFTNAKIQIPRNGEKMASDVLIQFTTTFIGGLAANLSGRILEESAREVRKLFRGNPEREALERCVESTTPAGVGSVKS